MDCLVMGDRSLEIDCKTGGEFSATIAMHVMIPLVLRLVPVTHVLIPLVT